MSRVDTNLILLPAIVVNSPDHRTSVTIRLQNQTRAYQAWWALLDNFRWWAYGRSKITMSYRDSQREAFVRRRCLETSRKVYEQIPWEQGASTRQITVILIPEHTVLSKMGLGLWQAFCSSDGRGVMTPMVHVSISPKQKSAVNVPLTSSQNGFLDCITRLSYHRKLKKEIILGSWVVTLDKIEGTWTITSSYRCYEFDVVHGSHDSRRATSKGKSY